MAFQHGIGHTVLELKSLLFPEVCMACGNKIPSKKAILCNTCTYELPRTNYHFETDNPVEEIFWGRITIERATSYYFFNKGSKFQKLMHALKYQGRQEVGIFFGRQMAQDLQRHNFLHTVDALVPVPLHPRKLHKRGYNQSAVIATGIHQVTGIPVRKDLAYRKVHSSTQTRKSRYERWQNVADIFGVHHRPEFKHSHLLLIDDVLTTGSTLEACAAKLIQTLHAQISIATLAKA